MTRSHPANPFPLARFLGRDAEIADILSLVSAHGQSAAIIGEPRIGKTSLLEHLASPAALAASPDLLVSHINAHTFGDALDAATFWTAVFEPLEAAGHLIPAADTPIGAAYRACRTQAFAIRAIERLLRALAAGGRRLVLLIDEFDFLVHRHIAAHAELFTGLRALAIGTHRAFSLIVASRAPVARLQEIAREQRYGGSPPFNTLTEILLGPLSVTEVDQILDAALDRFTPDDRRFVQALSGGYPHLVQTAASALFRAGDRRAAGLVLHREASQTLTDIWNHWPSTHRYVFAAVAVEHFEAMGARVAWAPAAGLVVDPATYPEELYALERHGFIAPSLHTPSGYIVRPIVFLAWCAVKLRGHAQSAAHWSAWMDAEGWSSAGQRQLWSAVILPRAAAVHTDLDTLLAAHAALAETAPYVTSTADAVSLFSSAAAPAAPTTWQRPLDLGIVVALPDELRELLNLAGAYTPHHDADLDTYLFERGAYRCAATLISDMGEAQAARVTERLVALWDPGSIIVVGIAGGVHDDLRVGDVHVASQAVQYLQDAKAVSVSAGGFAIVPGAPAYRADYALLAAARGFEFSHRDAYQRWIGDGRTDLAALISDAPVRDRLFAENLVRRDPRLLADGHVATGPVVGAAAAFSAWIRTHDRNVKALEMESAAVLLAAQTRGAPKRALAIRGISDYGDDRKEALDRIGGGSLRQYAMRNAVRLLFALLEAGALQPSSSPRDAQEHHA